jgi:hypothetical protein
MRVSGINDQSASASSRIRPGVHEAATNEAQTASTGRALIPLSPVQPSKRPRLAVRQPAGFLAHLIATKQAMSQTRERRRIEPNVAAAIYAAARDTVSPAEHEITRAL